MPTQNTSPTLLSSGTLDTTLAGDGTSSIQVGSGEGMARAIAIQPDGKYIFAGWSDSGGGNFDFTLLRLNPDGSPDSTFSGDGQQITALNDIQQAYDVAIQSDGGIVTVGKTGNTDSADFLITRYDSNGELDATFSGDGILTQTVSGQEDIASSVAIQTDGKIVVAGSSGFNYAIIRYNTNGTLDAGFDSDGMFTGSFGSNTSSVSATALQEDGKIIVAGYGWSGSSWDFGIARHTATGALDTSFSGDGKTLISLNNGGALETINAITIQADGKILLAGSTPGIGNQQDAVLLRLNTDGTLDASFGGGDGIVTLNTSTVDDFNSVQIQADRKIIAAGHDLNGLGNALIARFNSDGSLDTTFAGDGVFTTVFASGTSRIYDLALAGNGQIVAVGASYTGAHDFGLLRLDGGVHDQTALAGTAFSYNVPTTAFHDADGDPLIYTASLADGSPLPDWLAFDAVTATFSGTARESDFGTRLVSVHGSDGAATVTATFQLEVSTDFIEALRNPEHLRWNDTVANGTPGTALTYSFMTSAPAYALASESSSFAPMTESQKSAVRDVLHLYQEIVGLTFTEVADSGDGGQLRFGTNLDNTSGHSGYAYYPSSTPVGGDVWINRANSDNTAPQTGNAAYWILLHEIGHTLGLKHTGDYDDSDAEPFLAAAVDTNQYTVMSYNNHGEGASTGYFVSSPMLYDIAALQFLYGANTATRAGNNTYTFDPAALVFETLWDGGGTDTIDLSNFTQDSEINLRPGEFSSLRVLVPDYEWVGPLGNDNIAIAYGAVIENAIGGIGADTLIGNAADNILTGGLGNDTYIVDTPGDRVIETSALSSGIDSVHASLSWTLGANLENLQLLGTHRFSAKGNGLDNTLTGNDGNNLLNGGRGADTLIGGAGNDTYVVDNANDVIQETGADTGDSVRSWVDWTLGDNLENLTLLGTRNLDGSGNALDNSLTGNGAANVLNGGDGNDVLDGASGNDTLTGGAGADTFAFTTPLNTLRNVDSVTDFTSGTDKLLLSSAIFRDLGFSGSPSSDVFFHAGSTAHDADDRILYDQSTGRLSYDSDGAGALAAVQFAVLSGIPQIMYTDLLVV